MLPDCGKKVRKTVEYFSQYSNSIRIDPTLAEIVALDDRPRVSVAEFRIASLKSYPFSFLKNHERVEKSVREVAESEHCE